MPNYPEKKHVWTERREGHYNLLDLREKSVQYIFWNLPEEFKQRDFLINPDYDNSVNDNYPESVAEDLLNVYKTYYLWSSNKEPLEKIIKWLKDNEEEQDNLRYKYEIESSKFKMLELIDKRIKQIGKWNQGNIYSHPELDKMKELVESLWRHCE